MMINDRGLLFGPPSRPKCQTPSKRRTDGRTDGQTTGIEFVAVLKCDVWWQYFL